MNYLYLDPGSSGTKILTLKDFCCGYFLESGVKVIPKLTETQWEDEGFAAYSFGSGIVELGNKTYRVGYRPATCLSAGLKYTGATGQSCHNLANCLL